MLILALLAHWSVRRKLNHVSSVQLRRSVRALKHLALGGIATNYKKILTSTSPSFHISLFSREGEDR